MQCQKLEDKAVKDKKEVIILSQVKLCLNQSLSLPYWSAALRFCFMIYWGIKELEALDSDSEA